MGNFAVNDSACWAVTTSVSIARVLGEKTDMMPFPNDDYGNGGVDFQLGTSISQCHKFCKEDMN